MVIVSFYTSLYEEQSRILVASLEKFRLKYDVQKIGSRGSWKANCLYRGQFLINMMNKYNDNIVWLDADAEILKYPSVLFELDSNVDLAWYDREGREFMLGTSYWKNTPQVKYLLMDWMTNCNVHTPSISQRDFMKIFQQRYKGKMNVYILPETYCCIFDKPTRRDPVIVHYQLSRQTKEVIRNNTTVEVSSTQSSNIRTPIISRLGNKKTVFLSLNQPNWAFDVRCTILERLLSPYYNIKKVSGYDIAKKGLGFHADLVYWPTYESLDAMENYCHKVCATVGGLVVRSLDESVNHFGKAKAIAVPNKTWFDEYIKKGIENIKFFLIPNGVDINKFVPKLKSRNEFIIGWAGNDRPDRAKIKRIEELRRVCKKCGLTLLEQGRSSQISHDRMPTFYQQLDLYVNLSTTEGSNNCILEAAACGIPVLGTRVGNMPELEKIGAFTVDYNLRDLEEKLLYIRSLNNRRDVGDALRKEMVTNYSSEIVAMRYKEMFDYSLQK